MGDPSTFWNKMAERYARQPIGDEAAYQHKLKTTQRYFHPEMVLMEFGCGTGSTAITHAPLVKHVRATDFSEAMIAIAQDKAVAAGVSNIDFEVAAIDTMPVVPEAYDMVLGLSILHLLEDRDAALNKVFAMLKPGGLFVSSTVCIGDTMAFFKFVGPIGKAMGLLPHLDVMTKVDLIESQHRAGFSIEEEYQPGKGKAVFLVARKPG